MNKEFFVLGLVLSELIWEEEMTHMQSSSYNDVKAASVKQFGCHSSILRISQCFSFLKKIEEQLLIICELFSLSSLQLRGEKGGNLVVEENIHVLEQVHSV